MKVQLLYFDGCPSHEAAGAALERCLVALDLEPTFDRVDGSPDVSPALAAWGSPTIIVDGNDVAGEQSASAGRSCRIYPGGSGRPTDAQILAALRAAS